MSPIIIIPLAGSLASERAIERVGGPLPIGRARTTTVGYLFEERTEEISCGPISVKRRIDDSSSLGGQNLSIRQNLQMFLQKLPPPPTKAAAEKLQTAASCSPLTTLAAAAAAAATGQQVSFLPAKIIQLQNFIPAPVRSRMLIKRRRQQGQHGVGHDFRSRQSLERRPAAALEEPNQLRPLSVLFGGNFSMKNRNKEK